MSWKMFLDDWRNPKVNGLVVVRSFDDAVKIVNKDGCPTYIAFDYDLGVNKKTALDFAKWMINRDVAEGGKFIPANFVFSCHSSSEYGRKSICEKLLEYLNRRN